MADVYLLDTNILICYVSPGHVNRPAALNAIRTLVMNGDSLVTTPQSLMEFWVVATRPVVGNGLGLTTSEAEIELTLLESLFPPLSEATGLYTEWKRLVTSYKTSGKAAHDARFVAAAKLDGRVTHLLTFNTSDFVRYSSEGIVATNPASV